MGQNRTKSVLQSYFSCVAPGPCLWMMQILCRWKSEGSSVWYPALFFNTLLKIPFIQLDVAYILLVGGTFLQDSSRLLAQQLKVRTLSSAFWQMQIELAVILSQVCCQWQYPVSHALEGQYEKLHGAIKEFPLIHSHQSWLVSWSMLTLCIQGC